MAFRAQDVQASQRDDFVVFRFALFGKLVVHRLPLIGRHLKDFPLVLEEHHGDRGLIAVATRGISANHGRRRGIGHG